MSLKIVVFTDLHLDEHTAGVPRFDDVAGAVRQVVQHAVAWRADLVLCLGDALNPDRGSAVFRCMRVLFEAATTLTRERIRNYWIRGNHDVIEDGSDESVLTPLRALERDYFTKVFDAPALVDVLREGKTAARVLALPYPSAAAPYDPDAWVRENVISREQIFPLIVAGHLQFTGITPGEESEDMGRGRDVPFPLDALAEVEAPVKLFVNGHYHRGQVHRGVIIPGSMVRLRFGPQEAVEPRFLKFEIPEV